MPGIARTARAHAMWVCFYGPALSLLPARWRDNAFAHQYAGWRGSTILTAAIEFILGINFAFAFYAGYVRTTAFICLTLYIFTDGCWRALTLRTEGVPVPTLLFAVVDEAIVTVRKAIFHASHPDLPDEVSLEAADLKIESARAKRDWEAGRIVRCESRQGPQHDRYFRLESALQHPGQRPFIYLLRELEAGRPGVRVLSYTGALPESPQR